MTDSLKFGPEWLRNLSESGLTGGSVGLSSGGSGSLSSNTNTSSINLNNSSNGGLGTPGGVIRYQLAEFRYGREEMLALFSYSSTPSESLKNLPGLFVEKTQPPLALNTMTDEEARMWNRGINSDAVMRCMGKMAGGGEGGGAGVGGRGGLRRGGEGGRGGRGGGGRGAGTGNFYSRGGNQGVGGEENMDGGGPPVPGQPPGGPGSAPFGRRPFDRTQTDRNWLERNGGEGRNNNRGGSGDTNWRRHRSGGDEDDEWRRNKWMVGRGNSWREDDGWEPRTSHPLPEWATEKNEGGGTFDASGAFHGATDPPLGSDEEDQRKIPRKEKDKENEKQKTDYSKSREEREDMEEVGTSNDASKCQVSQIKGGGREEDRYERGGAAPGPAEDTGKLLEEERDKAHQDASSEEEMQPGMSRLAMLHKEEQQRSHNLAHSAQLSQHSVPEGGMQVPSEPQPPSQTKPHPQPQGQPQVQMAQLPVHPHQHQMPSHHHVHHMPMEELQSDLAEDHDNIATDIVSKLMDEEDKQDTTWFYKDPQGQNQGPFSCLEMAEWFQSGYFTLNLLVRRACDPNFSPLGELIKVWGCIPFLADQAQTKPGPLPIEPVPQEVLMHQQHPFNQQFRQMPAAAPRPGPGPRPGWIDPSILETQFHHAPQPAPAASSHLKALLLQMQQQQLKQEARKSLEVAPSSPVMDTIMSLHQQQQQQMAMANQAHHGMPQQAPGPTPLQQLLRQMQQSQQRANQGHPLMQQPPIESVWNGGWSQWNQINPPKVIKTEQQVIEEQLRAEDERKREEMRKQEEAVKRHQQNEVEETERMMRERERQEMNERLGREEELARRCKEEEDLRRKHEAARRAEVERQRKEEEKRKKEEEKRKKEEEKRKLEERERDRLKEEERKKEEEKKRQQDLMSKIQRAQWGPPAASNTSLLEIQKSEREQQMRIHQMAAAQQEVQQANNMVMKESLRWTDSTRNIMTHVESLAEIQAEQRQQLLKAQHEKEKAEKERKEHLPQRPGGGNNSANLGSWSQGLTWGGGMNANAPWTMNQQQGRGGAGFWDQLASAPPSVKSPINVAPQPKAPQGKNPQQMQIHGQQQQLQQHHQQQQQQSKESKNSKAKRDEMAVMKLFSSSAAAVSQTDEFTQWCTSTLQSLTFQASVDIDIPTFVGFLRDLESGNDVTEYVRQYIGDTKEAMDFAQQFLDRRSKGSGSGGGSGPGGYGSTGMGSASQSSHNPHDFQQVKSKGKKKQKGKSWMQKVDSRMLGFSTTAAADRINVGDRAYPDE